MATFAGAMLAVSPWTVAIVVPIFALIVWRTRIVSLGSLIGSALAPLVTAGLAVAGQATWAGVVLALGAATMVTLAHRDNLSRLRAGTERRIGQ